MFVILGGKAAFRAERWTLLCHPLCSLSRTHLIWDPRAAHSRLDLYLPFKVEHISVVVRISPMGRSVNTSGPACRDFVSIVTTSLSGSSVLWSAGKHYIEGVVKSWVLTRGQWSFTWFTPHPAWKPFECLREQDWRGVSEGAGHHSTHVCPAPSKCPHPALGFIMSTVSQSLCTQDPVL